MLFTSVISALLQLYVLCSICAFVEAVGCTSYSQLSITNVLTLCIISLLLLLLLLLCVCLTVVLSLCVLLSLSVVVLVCLLSLLVVLPSLLSAGAVALRWHCPLVRARVKRFVGCTILVNVSNHPRTCVRLNVRSLKRKGYSASGEAGHQRQGRKNRRTERTCVRLFAQKKEKDCSELSDNFRTAK